MVTTPSGATAPQILTPEQQVAWADSPARLEWAKSLLARANDGVEIENRAISEMKQLIDNAQTEVAKILQDYSGMDVPEWKLNRVNQQIAALDLLMTQWDAKIMGISQKYLEELRAMSQGLPASERARINNAIASAQAQITAASKGEGNPTAGSIPRPSLKRGGAGMVYADPRYLDIAIQYVPEQIKDAVGKLKSAVKQEIIRNALALDTPEASMARLTSVATPIGAFPTAAVRAEAIVRTEFGRVSQIANMSAIAQMAENPFGLPADARTVTDANGFMYKEWIAVGDVRTRPEHAALDGMIVRYDQPFLVGEFPAQYPKDPTLPAKHAVNCRCMVVPAFPPDVAAQMAALGIDANGALSNPGLGDYIDAAVNGVPAQVGGGVGGSGVDTPLDPSTLDPTDLIEPYTQEIQVGNAANGLDATGTPTPMPLPLSQVSQRIAWNAVPSARRMPFGMRPGTTRLHPSDWFFGRVTDIIQRANQSVEQVARSLINAKSIPVNKGARALLDKIPVDAKGKRKRVVVPLEQDTPGANNMPPLALMIKNLKEIQANGNPNYGLTSTVSDWQVFLKVQALHHAGLDGQIFPLKARNTEIEWDFSAWNKLPETTREYILRTATSAHPIKDITAVQRENDSILDALIERAQSRVAAIVADGAHQLLTPLSNLYQTQAILFLDRTMGKNWDVEIRKLAQKEFITGESVRNQLTHLKDKVDSRDFAVLKKKADGGELLTASEKEKLKEYTEALRIVTEIFGDPNSPSALDARVLEYNFGFDLLKKLAITKADPLSAEMLNTEKLLKEKKVVSEKVASLIDGIDDIALEYENVLAALKKHMEVPVDDRESWGKRVSAWQEEREVLQAYTTRAQAALENALHMDVTAPVLFGDSRTTVLIKNAHILQKLAQHGVTGSEDFPLWLTRKELQKSDSLVSKVFEQLKAHYTDSDGKLMVRQTIPGTPDTLPDGTVIRYTEDDIIRMVSEMFETNTGIYNNLIEDTMSAEDKIARKKHQDASGEHWMMYDNSTKEGQASNFLYADFMAEMGVSPTDILGESRVKIITKLFQERRLRLNKNATETILISENDGTTSREPIVMPVTEIDGSQRVMNQRGIQNENEGLGSEVTMTIDGSVPGIHLKTATIEMVLKHMAGEHISQLIDQGGLFGMPDYRSGNGSRVNGNSIERKMARDAAERKKVSEQLDSAKESLDAANTTLLKESFVSAEQDKFRLEQYLKALAEKAIDSGFADREDPNIQMLLQLKDIAEISDIGAIRNLQGILYGKPDVRETNMALRYVEALIYSYDRKNRGGLDFIQRLFKRPNLGDYMNRAAVAIRNGHVTDGAWDGQRIAEIWGEATGYSLRAVLTGAYTRALQKSRMGGLAPYGEFSGRNFERLGRFRTDKKTHLSWYELEYLMKETAALEAKLHGVDGAEEIIPRVVIESPYPGEKAVNDLFDTISRDTWLKERRTELIDLAMLDLWDAASMAPTKYGAYLLKLSEKSEYGLKMRTINNGNLLTDPHDILEAFAKQLISQRNSASTKLTEAGRFHILPLGNGKYYETYNLAFLDIRGDRSVKTDSSYEDSAMAIKKTVDQLIEEIAYRRAGHQVAIAWAADKLRDEIGAQIEQVLAPEFKLMRDRAKFFEKLGDVVRKMNDLADARKAQLRAVNSGATPTPSEELLNTAFKMLDEKFDALIKALPKDEFMFVTDKAEVLKMLEERKAELERIEKGVITSAEPLGSGVSGGYKGKIDGKKVVLKAKVYMGARGGDPNRRGKNYREDWGMVTEQDLLSEPAAQAIDELGGLFVGKAISVVRPEGTNEIAVWKIPKGDQSTDSDTLAMEWLPGWMSSEVRNEYSSYSDAQNFDLMAVYDALIANTDRHAGNFLLAPVFDPAHPQTVDGDGKVVVNGKRTGDEWEKFKIVPIDNGLSFPDADVQRGSAWGNGAPWLNSDRALNARQLEVLVRLWSNRVELHRRLSMTLTPGMVNGFFYRLIWMLIEKKNLSFSMISENEYSPQESGNDGVVASALKDAQNILDAKINSVGTGVVPGQIELGLDGEVKP